MIPPIIFEPQQGGVASDHCFSLEQESPPLSGGTAKSRVSFADSVQRSPVSSYAGSSPGGATRSSRPLSAASSVSALSSPVRSRASSRSAVRRRSVSGSYHP